MALVGDIQRVFERTYDRPAGVDLEACVIGPRRCAELASRAEAFPEISDWARFFFYLDRADLKLALFFSPSMIQTLEARDPRDALSESNVLPLLVLTEELSHAVHTTYAFADGGRHRIHNPDFLLELELQARIDAYLLLRLFVRGLARRFEARDRAWVRREAITRWDVVYEDRRLGRRYRGAARIAARFVDHLESLPERDRLGRLRHFRSLSLNQKRVLVRGLN